MTSATDTYRFPADPACTPQRRRPATPDADNCTACRGTGWSIYEDARCPYGHPDPTDAPADIAPLIEVNLHILRADATTKRPGATALNDSALCCVAEAEKCLARHFASAPFPGADQPVAGLPSSWLESARNWAHRGGQHAFGFYLPRDWKAI